MKDIFAGCGTALVTPFDAAGRVDITAVRRLARRQIDAGIHFLVPCGTTGETPTLTGDERLRIVEAVVSEANGKVPVLAGAGGYDTREVGEAARTMRKAGADGILSVTPYYNKPTPDGLVAHYRAIAQDLDCAVIVYNVPGRTGCNVDPATLACLKEIPNVAGVKEASGNMAQICDACALAEPGFAVFSGDDALTLPAMAVGARGIISVASNLVPEPMARMVNFAAENDFDAARKVHLELLPFLEVNFVESNPIPIKAAMAMAGLLDERYRLPMVPPREASRQKIAAVLDAMRIARGAPAR